ncbi:MAG: hypothetical protein GX629_07845 [Phycisphaerae bacterium]|jgi:uncharacterized protein YcfL|nr:hypothetical protein [Phycisphaerae bacterium]
MKRSLTKLFTGAYISLGILTMTGCNSMIKGLVIDQFVGFATAITSAGITSLVQLILGGTQ